MRNNLFSIFNLISFSLSGNKGLCGAPSLPSCPMFWEHGRLSTRGKVAISLSCLFVFFVVLLLVYIYIRRKRNDYDFGLPHELMCKYDFNEIVFPLSIFIYKIPDAVYYIYFLGLNIMFLYLPYQCSSFLHFSVTLGLHLNYTLFI